MSSKLILSVLLGFAVLMLVVSIFLAVLSHDTATHGQGPLNPRDLDSVRQGGAGAVDFLVPVIIGLGLLVTALGVALKRACTNGSKEAAR